jgi:hypothetical protein
MAGLGKKKIKNDKMALLIFPLFVKYDKKSVKYLENGLGTKLVKNVPSLRRSYLVSNKKNL